MDAKVTWQKRLTFTGTADSGFTLPLGSDPDVGGDNDGFRPMELLAISLAACTAMDVVSILGKKRQDVTAFDVQVHTERAEEHPRVFTGAVIKYAISGRGVDIAAVLRAIELSVTRYCPAHAMLSKVMPVVLNYSVFEDKGDGKQTLVKSGVFIPSLEPGMT